MAPRTLLPFCFALPLVGMSQVWLDPTFGTGGVVGASLDAAYDGATCMALQADGRIVVAGAITSGGVSGWDFLVARYLTDGSLDASFGTGGFSTYDHLDNDRARGVAIQADGAIVVVGTSSAGNTDKVILRFTPDGDLDNSFNGNGVRIIDDSFAEDQLDGVAIQPDQRIVVVGQGFNGSKDLFYIARLNSDGSFDTSFAGGAGELEHTITGDNCRAHAVVLQDDGRILSVGSSYTNTTTTWDVAVVRYLSDGTLDPSFEGDGTVVLPWSADVDNGLALCVQPDGKVLVGGAQAEGTASTQLTVARLLGTGALDTGFGVNGVVHPYTGILPTACRALALDASGRILVGGTIAANANESQSYLCRLLAADGAFDPAFGAGGELVYGAPFAQEQTPGMALQPDGKVVLAGSEGPEPTVDVRLIRYLATPITAVQDAGQAGALSLLATDAEGAWLRSSVPGAMTYEVSDARGACIAHGQVVPARAAPFRVAFPSPLPGGAYAITLRQGASAWPLRFVIAR